MIYCPDLIEINLLSFYFFFYRQHCVLFMSSGRFLNLWRCFYQQQKTYWMKRTMVIWFGCTGEVLREKGKEKKLQAVLSFCLSAVELPFHLLRCFSREGWSVEYLFYSRILGLWLEIDSFIVNLFFISGPLLLYKYCIKFLIFNNY